MDPDQQKILDLDTGYDLVFEHKKWEIIFKMISSNILHSKINLLQSKGKKCGQNVHVFVKKKGFSIGIHHYKKSDPDPY